VREITGSNPTVVILCICHKTTAIYSLKHGLQRYVLVMLRYRENMEILFWYRFIFRPLSSTYKVLTTNQPQCLHDLISVQPCLNTSSSSMVTLARPPTQSSLKITNCSFRYAALLCMERTPNWSSRASSDTVSCTFSYHTWQFTICTIFTVTTCIISLLVQSFILTWLYGKSFPPYTFSFPTVLIPRTLGPFNVYILLNGWICLHGVLD